MCVGGRYIQGEDTHISSPYTHLERDRQSAEGTGLLNVLLRLNLENEVVYHQ
jgi:hypothetical protein